MKTECLNLCVFQTLLDHLSIHISKGLPVINEVARHIRSNTHESENFTLGSEACKTRVKGIIPIRGNGKSLKYCPLNMTSELVTCIVRGFSGVGASLTAKGDMKEYCCIEI